MFKKYKELRYEVQKYGHIISTKRLTKLLESVNQDQENTHWANPLDQEI